MTDYITVNDGYENWILYEGDNGYKVALEIEPDEKGIRHVDPVVTEGMQTWWWRAAVDKAEALVDGLAIPWGELTVTDLDITDGNLMTLSEKLARTSFYIVQANNKLTRLLALNSAAKDTLEHAVSRTIGRDDDGRRSTKDVKIAAAISRDKRLRNLKIELIESTSAIKALETTKDSLETLWRTTSRIVSARLKEPID